MYTSLVTIAFIQGVLEVDIKPEPGYRPSPTSYQKNNITIYLIISCLKII